MDDSEIDKIISDLERTDNDGEGNLADIDLAELGINVDDLE